MRRYGLFLAVLVLSASAQARVDLASVSNQTQALADTITAETCASSLELLNAQLNAYRSTDFSRAQLRKSAKTIIANFWAARLKLREKMVEFDSGHTLSPACVTALRGTFASVRFMEEYVGLHQLAKGAWVDPKASRVFSGGFPMLVHAPDFKKIDLQSGDVLVSYGMAYGSAAISHVGDDPGTFSHMALIYKTAKGEIFTIEAHPEFGVKVAPIEKYLTDGKGRAALYRYHDPDVAALAAQRMYDIAAPPDAAGHPIPYDFSMNLEDHTKLFCTEVVGYAFALAGEELHRPAVLPAFPTHISMKNTYILDAFGIQTRVTFAPSDIEVDPRFTMIAEWRDLPRARLMHHQAAVLQKEFRWLDDLGYKYRSDLQTVIDSNALYTTRHLPLFDGLVDTLVPPDLSEKTIEAVVQVYLVSDQIHDALIKYDQAYEAGRGVLMTSADILDASEQDRRADLKSFAAEPHFNAQARRAKPAGLFTLPWHWIFSADREW